VPDLAALARLCLWSNGLLKRWSSPTGREIQFRSAGCTGARYHLELYLVCADLPGLDAGVYQYAAHDHTLRRLRTGDYRAQVVEATGNEPAIAQAPVIVVCTSTFWRNAWRYQERAYRHVYWDTGTLFANLLAVAASESLPARVVLGYADRQVNDLIAVDGEREAAVALIAIGRSGDRAPEAPTIGPLDLPTEPISPREIDFPLIREMHHASSLDSGDDASVWRATPLRRTLPPPSGPTTPLQPLDAATIPHESIVEVIQRRRSNRHYVTTKALSLADFSAVLDRATRGTAIDALDPAAPALYDPYLIVNNVEGLTPGTYVHHVDRGEIELLAAGDARADAVRLAYGQGYAGDAHVNVYAMTDLAPVLAHYGNRGYRLAQLDAAIFAGRLQLAAHALGLGAVGSTSLDDEVTALFSPHGAGKSFMFVAVFGHRRRPSATETEASSRFLKPADPSPAASSSE
jgi:SagB-type dehydrogenase family enzyme